MKRQALTDKQIKAIRSTTTLTQLTDGGGLYLKLQWGPDGAASGHGHQWRFDYTRPCGGKAGKRNTLSFGAYPAVTLATARDRAEEARTQIGLGVDPGAIKEAVRVVDKQFAAAVVVATERAGRGLAPVGTLQGVAQDFHARRVSAGRWVGNHPDKWLSALTIHVFKARPDIALKPIGTVEPDDVLAILDPIQGRGHLTIADCVRKYLSQVFNYGMLIKLCTGNPAYAVRDEAKRATPPGVNPGATTPEALRTVLHAIHSWAPLVTRSALIMQVMLFQRPAMTAGMRWADVDLDRATWSVIPQARTKLHKSLKGAAHIVALPTQAVALLRTLHKVTGASEWVFESPINPKHPITNDTMTRALRAQGLKGLQTAHGFRATARTMVREQLKCDPDQIEAQLAHTSAEELGSAYDRAKWEAVRVKMVQGWADYLDALMTTPVLKLAA